MKSEKGTGELFWKSGYPGAKSAWIKHVADVEELSVTGSPLDEFDMIFSNFVFHWVRDKKGMIRALARMLSPGGRLAFCTLEELPDVLLRLTLATGSRGKQLLRRL